MLRVLRMLVRTRTTEVPRTLTAEAVDSTRCSAFVHTFANRVWSRASLLR
jgi:hypothetical protein